MARSVRETPELSLPIEAIRLVLLGMSPTERVEFLSALTDGYCVHCGERGHCDCRKDE